MQLTQHSADGDSALRSNGKIAEDVNMIRHMNSFRCSCCRVTPPLHHRPGQGSDTAGIPHPPKQSFTHVHQVNELQDFQNLYNALCKPIKNMHALWQ